MMRRVQIGAAWSEYADIPPAIGKPGIGKNSWILDKSPEMPIDATCDRRIVCLLKISTIEVGMATVNFSVPDEVKAEFDKAFGDQNKSSIIAELMRRAVRERQLQIRRERLFRQLSSARSSRPSFNSEDVRRARAANRP